jgi:threonine synthase
VTTPLIERYRDRLPVSDTTPVVSLGEGSTPLLAAPRLSERLGLEVWLKWEASNPTGSYKDRGMTVAVSKAVEEGARAIVCASTGNTAAAAAAYGARAGLPVLVLQPKGAVAGGKLAQTRMLGALLLEVRGSFDEALAAARELADRGTHALVNSLNPYRREGQKTAVFEIVEELGGLPDAFCIPYGGGGNTSAYAQALRELGGEARLVSAEAERRPETVASAIRIAEPAHAEQVAEALARTNGRVVSLSDEAILDAWRSLARDEGLFCEPASAAGVAAVAAGGLEPGCLVVCVVTGHGLKDPETASRLSSPAIPVDPDPDAIAAAAAR